MRFVDHGYTTHPAQHQTGCHAPPPAPCAAAERTRRVIHRLRSPGSLGAILTWLVTATLVFVAGTFQPLDFPLFGRDPLVMLFAPLRVGQGVVGAVQDRHDARSLLVTRILIRVVFLTECLVGGTYDFLRCHPGHLQIVIVSVYLCHRSNYCSASA